MLPEMSHKDADIQRVADKALADNNLLLELLAGLQVKQETLRYNCSKVLTLLSQKHGEVLYPHWGYFAVMLGSTNTYWKLSAILIIANLTRVDTDNKFETLFDNYYALLDDKSMITAIYIASNSGKIVKSKPHLEAAITNRLLDINQTHHTSDRKDLIKANIIEALDEYYKQANAKERIIAFVEQQLNSSSPKARKTATRFLQKWQ